MRSTILLTSAMAIGAIAGPLNKRYIVTSIELDIETVTVYVTATAPAAPVPTPVKLDGNEFHDHSRVHFSKRPTSKAIVVPVPSSKAAPKPTSVYTPPPPPPPSSTPAPIPAPASTSVYTPAPVASSKAPAPSVAASNGQHLTGEIQDTLSSGPDYEAAILYHHNAARANHGAQPLVWDESCRANAEIVAKRCDFKHYIPANAGQGQNLFTVSGPSFNVTAGVTESWYKGEFQAMTDNNLWGAKDVPLDIFHSVGHLTQILWKGTTKVGCVSYDCGGDMTIGDKASDMNKYTVCNYANAGNVVNAYDKNVGLPSSYSNLGSWSD
ncbi:PR-1-like protein [Melanomma pulvis-pyrius CBS 109.77]|uniref:PR-1-like protein n=1 Tax=Melanomma pulvis-pyrius CBS 109.77 TaxID=1314802 RepID=A0A6A6WWD9_9PLEO|nr:PR-1-like protein [Melanomma pulvis-pyrius CBS 109.77]